MSFGVYFDQILSLISNFIYKKKMYWNSTLVSGAGGILYKKNFAFILN